MSEEPKSIWKNFRRFLFGLACFITLIAMAYAEEDFRGWHAWNKYKHALEAKGEKFDIKQMAPTPVPDDQNFALTPIVSDSWRNLLTPDGKMIPGNKRDENFVSRMNMPVVANYTDEPTKGAGRWQRATFADLKPWQDYYRQLAAKTNLFPVPSQPQTPAQDVLFALSKYDSTVEELREASKLPYSRFPLEYDKDDPAAALLPHLAPIKSCAQLLQLRALAELQEGQTEKALADIKLMFYLNNSIHTEPFLISHLVRIAMMEITMQPIYEGLANHQWSDAQLAELDSELSKFDFLADYEFSMRGEQALSISDIEYLRRSRNFQALDYDDSGNYNSSHSPLRLTPASFFYFSELNIARLHQQYTLPMVDLTNRIVSPQKVSQLQSAADKDLKHGWPYNILAEMLFPALENAVKKFTREQSVVDLARVAIALERFRIAHGEFPESLEAIASEFPNGIPHDVINGEPLIYRRTSDGQFILYSVGWNERDDGGTVVLGKGSTPVVDISKGDWVWRYP